MHVLLIASLVILGQEHAMLVNHLSHSMPPPTHAHANQLSIFHLITSAQIVMPTALLALTQQAHAQVAAHHSV